MPSHTSKYANQAIQLPPPSHPIGLFPTFFAQKSEAIVLKERVRSLSGGSFSIKTVDGRPVFQVKGQAFSLSGRKAFMDMQGNVLFTIRKEHFSIPACHYGEDASGKRIFEVKSKWTFPGSKAVCSFVGPDGKREELVMKGDMFDSMADITDDTGMAIATIDRKFFNARELLGGQQTYVVSIAPNVDMAIVAACCICLDEKREGR